MLLRHILLLDFHADSLASMADTHGMATWVICSIKRSEQSDRVLDREFDSVEYQRSEFDTLNEPKGLC